MKQLSPDLFDGTTAAPAAQPLRKRKREAFCSLMSGECYDNQTEAYHRAFNIADRAVCSAAAARLMRDPEIRARLAHLRAEAIAELGIDRLWIINKRRYIAEHGKFSERLAAIDAIERSQGLDEPIKVNLTGNMQHNHTGGILNITDPLAFARAMEAVRAARANKSDPPRETTVFANNQ